MRDFSGALKNDSEWFTGSGAKLGPASSGAKIGPAFSEPCSGTGAQIGPSEPDFPPAQRSGVGEKRPNPNDSSDSSAEDQQPTKQRVLSKEEVREVCAASAGALPAGMFSKVYHLIFYPVVAVHLACTLIHCILPPFCTVLLSWDSDCSSPLHRNKMKVS
jgi:hypothetical protein